MSNWYPLGWLLTAIALLALEFATYQLVSIWFAVGAVFALFISLTGVPFSAQLAVFVLVSCGALIASRPLVKSVLTSRKIRTNADAVVGSEGIVTEPIDNLQEQGRVSAMGLSWSARSEDGQPISEKQPVRVLAIEGVKLIVRPVNPPEP
ncbi:MAG: NfeD family protein [Provencibacterium sp.]|jgi:membrane protein implicated in regulation of membrane protease activity|nr:NfeD family protein [Provencibacterium sp.]